MQVVVVLGATRLHVCVCVCVTHVAKDEQQQAGGGDAHADQYVPRSLFEVVLRGENGQSFRCVQPCACKQEK